MRVFATCCCLLFAVALLEAVDYRPSRAMITMQRGGEPQQFYVLEASIDRVVAGQDPGAASGATIPFSQIAEIQWIERDEHMDYARGLGALAQGRFEQALESFGRLTQTRKQALVIAGYEGQAKAYAGLEQWTEAIAALSKIIEDNPKWPWLPDIIHRKGSLQIAAGNHDAASQTFADLGRREGDFGQVAVSSSLLGLAEVRIATGDNEGAATLLAEAFGKTDVDADPALRGRIGLKLARQQDLAGRADAAHQTLDAIKYLPLPPDDLARVHAQLAGLLFDRGQLRDAFDHAVMGTLVSGAEAGPLAEARGVARRVQAAIEASEEGFTNEEKLAYREAYGKL